MRVAYLTTDEVHEQLAFQMAEDYDVTLLPLSPRDVLPRGRLDALLYDWDCLSVRRQCEIAHTLLAGPALCPRAVHSYTLREHQAETLRRREVAVFRHLQPEVFVLLRLLASRAQDNDQEEDQDLPEPLAHRLEELRKEPNNQLPGKLG